MNGVCVSMAAWPGVRHEETPRLLRGEVRDPLFGLLSTEHVQLVPQTFGTLTEELTEFVVAQCPRVRFRLHANARVLPTRVVVDLASFDLHQQWFQQAARVSKLLGAPAYVAHPGRRAQASLKQIIDAAWRCAELFDCRVGIEGLYPSSCDDFLVSTWAEYRQVFDSGIPFAIDLSHVHILATRTGVVEWTLLEEMLACERCLEVHVSDNDGCGDWHHLCKHAPWWLPLLSCVHRHAVVFSEGNQRRPRSVA